MTAIVSRAEFEARQKRKLQVTLAAAEAAGRLGLTLDQLIERARAGAPVTDPRGNRRYDNLVMHVHGDTVYGVWNYDEPFAAPPSKWPARKTHANSPLVITADCPICDGTGDQCNECRDTGKVTRTREEYDRLQQLAITTVN